jgi:hypothetical protein
MGKLVSFKLSDILEKATNNTISLPTVQRSFVWKPYQIENLWDSLLRGYPVGSFVLAPKNDSNDAYELLDGQQRATAICLGFYDPLIAAKGNYNHNSKIFKASYESIMIFIDLAILNPENDNRKYLFRVITKSHPWGYRRQENQKILESENITKAMSCYKIENYDYLKKPLNEYWPYDSYRPLPIGLFINAAINNKNLEDLEKSIEEWKNGRDIMVIDKRNDAKVNYYAVSDIFNSVKSMLANCIIPLLFLDMSKLYGPVENHLSIEISESSVDNQTEDSIEDDFTSNPDQDEDRQINVENRSLDEIENLFIRLNSGGTPLRGEELNYSVLKAHINSDLQELIEKKCKGIFYPARFITIAFRLFNNIEKKSATDKDYINMKIKPKQFQQNIKNKEKKEDFIRFITDKFITDDSIAQIKSFMTYNKDSNPDGLPIFIVNSLADKAPEIIFMLLYRLIIKEDQINSELKYKVLGIITLFAWLGKGHRQKDHSKLLNNIWPCVREFDTIRFWSSETIQRAMLLYNNDEVLTPFPSFKELGKIIKKEANIRNLTESKIHDSNYGRFIRKTFYNKDLILYAQRDALSEWFHEIEGYNLDDTDRAFDWDHISPNNAIRSKRNVHRALKDWYHSNGNMRAWPYSLNRQYQDEAPSEKLCPKSDDDIARWSKYYEIGKLNSIKPLHDYILRASFCEKEWLALTSKDIGKNIKDNATAKKITYCILNRSVNICKEWYEKLYIDELFPESPYSYDIIDRFEKIINKVMWRGEEEYDGYAYKLLVDEKDLYIYFSFYLDENTRNTLKDRGIAFGLEFINDDVFSKINIKKSQEDMYNKKLDHNYIGNTFTLVSYSEASIINLFKEFRIWLTKYPDKDVRNVAVDKFSNSIKAQYRAVINEP